MRLGRPRRVLVLGGARSGKSRFAEELLSRRTDVDYVACGPAADGSDAEWDDRVAVHRSRRPASWRTLETVDLPAVLRSPGPPVLLDCLSTWLARTMDDCGVWTGASDADARLAPHRARGQALYERRHGQLQLSCAICHDQNAGGRLGGTTIPQAHPTGYPLYRLEWQGLGSLQRRLRNCMTGVRAEPYAYGSPEWVELELFLMSRASGMTVDAPAVRP